jgi:phosphatidylserine/phosphatidylglycerophosphate/cardiolipin synthase-like enzyme
MKSRGDVEVSTSRAGLIFAGALLLACGGSPPGQRGTSTAAPTETREAAGAEVELVESAPVETTLDHADVRDAAEVWPELIDRAKRTLDFSEFYASEAEGERAKASRLAPVVAAIERAVKRGVRVRFLADALFAPKYPATLERLRTAGVLVKTIDCAPRYGGVQHAKYIVIDGEESFIGSQNFDWRALTHIQEMGARVRSSAIAGALLDVFETDWALADASAASDLRTRAHAPTPPEARARTGEALALYASPKGWLPDESRWDLPHIVALLDGARSSVDVQVLTYSTQNRDKSAFPILDEAVRRAAARSVRVRLLVSHWGANAGSHARASIEALAAVPNVEVRVLTIPPWSGGEIPFARVSHAKYMIVDERAAWVGTSNWEGDYFFKSRNVGLVAEGGRLAPRLTRIFEDGWSSAYAAPLQARDEAASRPPSDRAPRGPRSPSRAADAGTGD